jgi:hypothetical protein
MGRDPMAEIGMASPREPCPSGSPSDLSLVFMGRRSEVGSLPVTPAEETGEMTMIRCSQWCAECWEVSLAPLHPPCHLHTHQRHQLTSVFQ